MIDNTLLKRVKRHVSGRTHSFFAASAPGLESLCFQELTATLEAVSHTEIVSGGVAFKGRLKDAYGANLELRTPTRILMRIASFKASNFRQLERHVGRIPWELYITPAMRLQVHVKTVHSRLYHTTAISDRIQQGINTKLGGMHARNAPSAAGAIAQDLFVRAVDDRFVISLDSSGAALYKRGLKIDVGKAPLRESLAAAALAWAGYTGKEPLIDPMCGSGTFSLEAALISNRIPPGWYRNFAFMNWPAFKAKQWQYLKNARSRQMISRPSATVFASDIDPTACAALGSVIRQFSLANTLNVAEGDFFNIIPDDVSRQPGVVALNPPFGVRLGSAGKSRDLYTEIASKLKKDYKGWRAAILLSDRQVLKKFPAGLTQRIIQHGGLQLTLLTGQIV